jgi:UTP--glucose-1-phosphate uridylyltransferase
VPLPFRRPGRQRGRGPRVEFGRGAPLPAGDANQDGGGARRTLGQARVGGRAPPAGVIAVSVRRAVITAAGLGTRFLPATKAQPKEMLPLIDRPAIEFVVEEVAACGIRDVLVVTGRHKRAIEDHFDLAPELEWELSRRGRRDLVAMVQHAAALADFHYVRQKEPRGLGDAVLAAERHVAGEPFALLLPDDVIRAEPPCLAQLLAVHARHPDCCVVAVQAVPASAVQRYGIVRAAAEAAGDTFFCSEVVEKPDPAAAPSDLAIIGRYVLPPDVFDHLRGLGPGAGGEIQLTDALAALARRGRLIAHRFVGTRWDTGDPANLLKSAVRYALTRPDLRAEVLGFLREVLDEAGAG